MKVEVDGERIDIEFLDPGEDDEKLKEYAQSWSDYGRGLLIQAVIVGRTRYALVVNDSNVTKHLSFDDEGYLGWSEQVALEPWSDAFFVEMFEPSNTPCPPVSSASRS